MTCQLENIVAIYLLPVRHEINHRGEAIARLGADDSTFDHYKCDKHDCTFKQWRAVLAHIGQAETPATPDNSAASKKFYGEGMITQAAKEIDLDTALIATIHKATRAYNGADIPPLVTEIKQAFTDANFVQIPKFAQLTDRTFTVNGKKVMTGQEWLDRFNAEFPAKGLLPQYDDIREQVWQAAKKAAGIEL